MKVVVTGAGGFIGSCLVERLRREGALTVSAVSRATADLAADDAVVALLDRERPDVVVHLAASIDHDEGDAGRIRQWRDTFGAGRMLLERAAQRGVRHAIVAGSIEELGPAEGVLDVDRAVRPASSYALCKALLHEVADFLVRRHRIRIDWFRPFTVFGPGQGGSMLIPYAFRAARDGVPADFTDGTQERDFVFVDDVVDWIVLALRAEAPNGWTEGAVVHHVGTGIATPVRDILTAIAEEFSGARFRLGARPRRAGEPSLQVAATRPRSGAALEHWAATTPWRVGVARTAAWWRAA